MELNELFGLEEAQPQGENGQESADPADNAENTAQETPDAEEADSAEEDGGEEGQELRGEGSADGDTGSAEDKGKQSKEDNAAYAAARRKAEKERDIEVAKAKQETDRVIAEFLRETGVTNPYTGKPIETREEYEKYRAQLGDEQKKQFVEKSGVTEAEFDAFINSLPQVRAARAAEEQAKAESAKARIEAQFREIQKIDASIGTLEDLTKMDTYPQFYEQVKRGASFVDAYKLANYDRLMADASRKTRQAALNAAAGKDHLAKTSTRGSGATDVPADVAQEYRNFMPGATDAEIRAHYNKYMHKK